eukprot:801035-Rhodomonas_salina.2
MYHSARGAGAAYPAGARGAKDKDKRVNEALQAGWMAEWSQKHLTPKRNATDEEQVEEPGHRTMGQAALAVAAAASMARKSRGGGGGAWRKQREDEKERGMFWDGFSSSSAAALLHVS